MPRKYKVSLEYQREITRINRNIKAKERRLRAKGYNVRLPVKTKNQFTTKEQVENYLEKQKEVAKTHYYYNKRTRELIPADVPWYDHFSIGAGVVGAGVLIFSILK